MRTPHARIERLENAVRAAVQPGPSPIAVLFGMGLSETEVDRYVHLCDLAHEETPEVRQDFAVALADPARMKEVLGILASFPEAAVKGLTMAAILAREGGPAILTGLGDAYFADREGGDHADTPGEN